MCDVWINDGKQCDTNYKPCSKPERSQRTELASTGGLALTKHRRVTLDDSTTIKGLKRPNLMTGASAIIHNNLSSHEQH